MRLKLISIRERLKITPGIEAKKFLDETPVCPKLQVITDDGVVLESVDITKNMFELLEDKVS
jgi:hypothetical protein